MAMKPLTTEAIALTEKKMDMTLENVFMDTDEIIKMSKKYTSKGKMPPRPSIKNRGFANAGASRGNSMKVQRFMDNRSSIRQGVLAQRRSNFQGNHFSLTTEVARKAAVGPIRRKVVNWNRPRVTAPPALRVGPKGGFSGKMNGAAAPPQTLDALFAGMKEQRMKFVAQRLNAAGGSGRGGGNNKNRQRQRQRQQQRQGGSGGFGRQFGNTAQ
ncbi:hypothetical protein QJS10_CPB12g00850 [Acorus calamus]|uniref:Uncharacterized protein n=1 Tax=Acorus calamus TaxID=4465 RepID=A0AAV9DPJ0_ACOCL|nr:hypothetical protein QJS10_CPB12g00850 [Acorus calamus]